MHIKSSFLHISKIQQLSQGLIYYEVLGTLNIKECIGFQQSLAKICNGGVIDNPQMFVDM